MSFPSSDASRGAVFGLAAAVLFGASAPLAKLFLPEAAPVLLAGLLYAGAGVALTVFPRPFRPRSLEREARLRLGDLPTLLGIVVAGGVLGPVLMLVGLARVPGTTGALLLNLEAPLTVLVAVAVFREHLERQAMVGSALIVLGSVILSTPSGFAGGRWAGILAISGACACWAIDDNLTQRLSLRNPLSVVRFKTVTSGTCLLAASLATGTFHVSMPTAVAAISVGSLSYGLSVLLATYSLRAIGAAREAAYFATAPFAGAILAVPILGERPGVAEVVAGALFLGGVALLLRSRHEHLHEHAEIEHDHLHRHDEHHAHEHAGPVHEPHSHLHRHSRLVHTHPHASDLHHRHDH